jgi:hypothetical protein
MSGMYTSDPILEMPSANVSIHIVEVGTKYYSIDIEGTYLITASELRNSSLAFVYPSSWDILDFNGEQNFTITLDGEDVSYNLTTFEEIENSFGIERPHMGLPHEDLSFAQFNTTLEPDTNHILEVETSFNQSGDTDHYAIYYYFGSATSFSGDTHEIISVVIEQQTLPVELNLNPEDGLTITSTGYYTEAQWDFMVSEMESTTISIAFNNYNSVPPQVTLLQYALVGGGAVIVVMFILLKRRRTR